MTTPKSPAQDTTYAWLRAHVATFPRAASGFITESEVASALGISRTPVREALLRLEAEGFVQILPKKGAFVPAISDVEVDAVMQARGVVEGWCVRRLAGNAGSLVSELKKTLKKMKGLVDDSVAFIECDRSFHRAIVQAVGNAVIEEFYESLRDRQVRMGLQAVTSSQDRASRVLSEHRAIADALLGQDPDAATAAVIRHLESTHAVIMGRAVGGLWTSIAVGATP